MEFELLVTLAAVVVPTVEILGILTAWHAVINVRSAQGSIAWSLSLVTFPWLALPLYWIFGRNKFNGYVESLRAGRIEHQDAVEQVIRRIEKSREISGDRIPEYYKVFEKMTILPFTPDNRVELLIDGPAFFGAMFESIDKAQNYILVQYYIINDDETGRELKSRLTKKAEEGVRIYFQYDEIGSHNLPRRYINDLRKAGVKVSSFHTTKGRGNRFQLNFRNHRKITVIDGHTAFVGGHNIGDEYMGRNPRFGRWRDTHLKIEGSVIADIQISFVNDWHWSTGSDIDLNWDFKKAETDGPHMLAMSTGPADELENCSLMFVHAIHSARRRFWLASPYFIPNEAVLEALQIAALRGVDVRIILPFKADHRTVYLAGFSYILQLDLPGIRFYRYKAGFLHQKAMLIDDDLAIVGTANADNRSFRLNFEIMMLIFGREFADRIKAMFERDFAESVAASTDDYHCRGMFFKLGVKLARLLSPLL